MDFGKPFTFLFDDPGWIQKISLAALISLIPIFGWIFLMGWFLDSTRRIIRQEAPTLPAIAFTTQMKLGIKGWIVLLAYFIPVLVLLLPVWIATATSSKDIASAADPVALLVVLCMTLVILLYALLINLVIPAALSNLAARETVSAGVNPREIYRLIRAAPGAYLVDLAGVFIAGLIAPLGLFVLGIGVIFTGAYAVAVTAHFYGQAYREAIQNLKVSPIL